MRNPEPAEYNSILCQTDRIVRWSFAPELEGSEQFLRVLNSHGIVASLAHSNATCSQVFRAYEQGMVAMTHFYSAMSGIRREEGFRIAGAIEAGYLLDDMVVEVIADGVHLPKELLQLIYKIKGEDHICLVTDSTRGTAMPNGNYVLGSKNEEGGFEVLVEDGVAKLPDRTGFGGSVATADRLVRTFAQLTDTPLHKVIKMMTINPAKLLKIDKETGSITEGKAADLVIFDKNINVEFVMVKGNIYKE